MSLESTANTVVSNLNPVDFAEAFFASSVQKPWNAVAQLSGDRLPSLHLAAEDRPTLAAQAGNVAGFAADMIFLTRLSSKAINPMLKGVEGPAASAVKMGIDGAIYGGIFMSSDNNRSLLQGRLENAAINGITFAAMGGAGHALDEVALFGPASLKTRVLESAISGAGGGVAHSFAQAAVKDQSLPSIGDVVSDTGNYAAFGAFFGAAHHGALKWEAYRRASKLSAAEKARDAGSDRTQLSAVQGDGVAADMAERAALRVKNWYGLLEPRLGIRLTDPNVVLTLADARGQTEFYITNPKPLDGKAFESLNSIAEPEGIQFQSHPLSVPSATGESTLLVNVKNLSGYERTINASKLPGIARFDARDGFDGLRRWELDSQIGVASAKLQGLYSDTSDIAHVQIGVAKGYPDEAVLACNRSGSANLVSTAIPHSDHYLCAEPNYSFDIKDSHVIEPHASHWGAILQEYYESPLHRAMASDPVFNQTRQMQLSQVMDEWRRAGFWLGDPRLETMRRNLLEEPLFVERRDS